MKPEQAEKLATLYHLHQTRRDGTPYISHPIAVAGMVKGKDAKCVAFLHDVIEDTTASAYTLSIYNVPWKIIRAVGR